MKSDPLPPGYAAVIVGVVGGIAIVGAVFGLLAWRVRR